MVSNLVSKTRIEPASQAQVARSGTNRPDSTPPLRRMTFRVAFLGLSPWSSQKITLKGCDSLRRAYADSQARVQELVSGFVSRNVVAST